jgi:hypothetical protein
VTTLVTALVTPTATAAPTAAGAGGNGSVVGTRASFGATLGTATTTPTTTAAPAATATTTAATATLALAAFAGFTIAARWSGGGGPVGPIGRAGLVIVALFIGLAAIGAAGGLTARLVAVVGLWLGGLAGRLTAGGALGAGAVTPRAALAQVGRGPCKPQADLGFKLGADLSAFVADLLLRHALVHTAADDLLNAHAELPREASQRHRCGGVKVRGGRLGDGQVGHSRDRLILTPATGATLSTRARCAVFTPTATSTPASPTATPASVTLTIADPVTDLAGLAGATTTTGLVAARRFRGRSLLAGLIGAGGTAQIALARPIARAIAGPVARPVAGPVGVVALATSAAAALLLAGDAGE